MYRCTLVGADFRTFLNALERSGCAERLKVLIISGSGLHVGNAFVLADLLGRSAFPALKHLHLDRDFIPDAGVVALVEALLKPLEHCCKDSIDVVLERVTRGLLR